MSASPILRVVEITSGAGASYTARYLVALGALVTKVNLDGSATARLPELDLGKQIARLDLTLDDGRARLDEILDRADVVIRAWDGAEVDASPVSLADLRAAHPELITAAITPFGETGPNSHHKGTDLIAIHAGGLGYGTPPRVIDPEAERPLGIPGDVVEPLTGMVAVLGILHALAERDHDGRGRHVEVSAQDAVTSLMFSNIAGLMDGRGSPSRLAADRRGARRPFLPASDGLLVQMAGRAHHRTSWLELLGPPGKALLGRHRSRR